jgi:hypothetical protein
MASAGELCAEALRHDPENATAHSLLGDVLQDQGRLEEARHCYRRALELSPDRNADRGRLSRAEEVLEARRRRAEWEAVVAGKTPPVAARLMVRESLQRVVALAGAVVCAVVLVLAVLATANGRAGSEEPEGAPRPPVTPSSRMIATETRRERDLLTRVRAISAAGVGQPVRVELDPVTQTGVVRVLLPTRARERAEQEDLLRELSMREGYRAARALHQEDDSLAMIHVYVVAQMPKPTMGPNSGPGPDLDTFLLLRGSLARENLLVEADKQSAAELQQLYVPLAWGTPVPGS